MFGWIRYVLFLVLMVFRGCENIPIDNDLLPIKVQADAAGVTECDSASADFLFVVDGSTSIGEENFDLVRRFMASLVEDIPAEGRRVAVIQFSGTPRTEFAFDTFPGAPNEDITSAILKMPYKTGTTKIGLALTHAITDVLIESKGDRPDVPNIVLTITDGRSQDDPLPPSELLRQMGHQTLALGVTDAVDDKQLEAIAGDPESVFKADDFSRLDNELKEKIKARRRCVTVTQAPVLDTGLRVECGPDKITIYGRTRNPFDGHVFAKGHYSNDSCAVQGDGSDTVKLVLPTDGCGTRRRRSLDPPGYYIENLVHFKFHPKFTTKVDRPFRIQCFFMEATKRRQAFVAVSVLTPANFTSNYPMPQCEYTVHQDSPDGPEVRFAVVGQSVFHKWECNDTSGVDFYGMRVFDCYVRGLDGENVPVLDSRGCSIDKFVMGNLDYAPVGLRATVETHVFKFADSANLQFQCDIAICIKEEGGCQDTPPVCADPPSNITQLPSLFQRLKRDTQPIPKDYLGVETKEINVLDIDGFADAPDIEKATADANLLTGQLNSDLDPRLTPYTPQPIRATCVDQSHLYTLVGATLVVSSVLTAVLFGVLQKFGKNK